MPDLFRDFPCLACGQPHNLFDTSAVRSPPGQTYSYTCPMTRLVSMVVPAGPPETVRVLPDNAVPLVRAVD